MMAVLFYIAGATMLWGQAWVGDWEGLLSIDGQKQRYTYELSLTANGAFVSGASFSQAKGDSLRAHFLLSGSIANGQLRLQETEQLFPEEAWCLKFLSLELRTKDGQDVLEGDWQAQSCSSGKLWLYRKTATDNTPSPAYPTGRWTGTLGQTDRDYSFYYELDLAPDGRGQSYIVSEGSGGSARHTLSWTVDSATKEITLSEHEVIERSRPNWKWCLKQATLQMNIEDQNYSLTGDWAGQIENSLEPGSACAPGRLQLKQALPQGPSNTQPKQTAYQTNSGRKVKIARVVKVAKPQIRIRVWDNGSVDGDIITVYLNGKRLVERHRVTKRKFGIPVTLLEGDNLLLLHAENLGDVSPNTVAIALDDGENEQIIVLSSDLEESGAILVKTFEYVGE